MYRKILVPLDGSPEAEQVVPIVDEILAPEGEAIFLKVINPSATKNIGAGQVIHGTQFEESERANAKSYLQGVIRNFGKATDRWRSEATIAGTIADGITSFAITEEVDLIAMRTHDRKGLAKLIKGSVAQQVKKRAPIDVRVFTPKELEAEAPERIYLDATVEGRMELLKQVDVFGDLTEKQIEMIASLARESYFREGDVIAKAGEPADDLIVVLAGEAQLSAESGVGDITVRIAGFGDSFPLAGLVTTGESVTSAWAVTDMDVLSIPCIQFTDLCSKNPDIGYQVYQNIADVFVRRYSKTLAHLTLSAEKALEANLERV